jgi:hypothetical protein
MAQVLQAALGNSMDYGSIRKLIGEIERVEVPSLLAPTTQQPESASPGLLFQRASVRLVKDLSLSILFPTLENATDGNAIAILKLNIGWFAEVLSETPHNIDISPYHASVINVHNSSFELPELVQNLANYEYEMLTRYGMFWSNVFSAAVCYFVYVVVHEGLTQIDTSNADCDTRTYK